MHGVIPDGGAWGPLPASRLYLCKFVDEKSMVVMVKRCMATVVIDLIA